MAPTDLLHLSLLTPVQQLGLGVVLLGILYAVFVQRPNFAPRCPRVVSDNLPVVGALGFWTHRHEWWLRSQQKTKSKNFSFHVGKHQLIGTSTEQGRKAYFESRDLDFGQGYAVLFGQGPDVSDDDGRAITTDNFFHKRITAMMRKEYLSKGLPKMIADVRARLNELGASGETDPFDNIYKLIYLNTQRTVGATEIAENRQLLDTTLGLFEQIEKTATPYQIMFPWLPSPALFKRYYAGTRMFMIFKKIVDARKKSGNREDDCVQFLMDQGDSVQKIISFVLGALFAGQLNSGINAAWILCYLACNQRWIAEVRHEVVSVTNKHIPEDIPLVEKLSRLPIEVWESEFPLLDFCLRDSIRLQLHGSGFRKNISGKDIVIDNEVIPPNAFLLYHFGEHHQNPEVFEDPKTWDPARYLPDRAEDRKVPNAFLGWGTGRHPCLGMKFAKLESNVLTAFFVSMFDFELLDDAGKKLDKAPEVNMNNWQASKPERPVKIRYTLREKAVS